MNMNYRNVEYSYDEWITFDGNQAKGYHCGDKELLKGISTISFGATTEAEMHTKIDHYIDNRQENLDQEKLTDEAMSEWCDKYGTTW